MTRRDRSIAVALAACVLVGSLPASAACMNKYALRSDGPRRIFTLLTGKLTFPEAQELAKAIREKKSPGLEWVSEKGKSISQHGDLKVIRPMPVGCDGRKSGVVMNVTFNSVMNPSKKVSIKLDADRIVDFELSEN